MPSGLEFGVYQCIVHRNLIPASLGRDKRNALDLRLKVFEELIRQAHGPIGVVSDGAINDGNF